MSVTEHWHTAKDGKKVFYRRHLPEGAVKGVVHVSHGMAEHGARYAPLAGALTREGFAVYVNDHRGHGRTATGPEELGFFEGGIGRVIDDLFELIALEKQAHPGAPLVLFGHSMGSYLAQELMLRRAEEFRAVVLSASAGRPNALASAGRYVARVERARLGPKGKSGVLRALSFDAFNKPFKGSGPTRFEWLSRDRAEVEKYVADPLCGFDVTTQLWVELLDLLPELARPERQARLPKSLPVYVLSGSDDMANDRTKSLEQLLRALGAAGLTDVTRRFYEGARHETLNETNRAQVIDELVAWLNARVQRV